MGTREVYEEKLRSGAHLHRDPTINPGLGSPRCPRCLSLLNPTAVRLFPYPRLESGDLFTDSDRLLILPLCCAAQGEGDWAITSVLHDATAVAGSGAGALLSAVHGFNTGIPFVQKHVKGPKWLQLLVGVPPLLMFSGASAVFGVEICSGSRKLILDAMATFTCINKPAMLRRDGIKILFEFYICTCNHHVIIAAYALPRFAQLTVTSYYAASSGSHYAVSQITRQIESAHFSDTDEKSR
ncbi:hypothetical protein PR202_gn00822 [Eleusine coracana subsp. coracana]|uniref:Uncharacterized protein n=1 Tax=Eleusine coracana subsp. coracana TaxID=191504 RepID=A0AAV5G5D5_ELECO|nr:hypothetical protein PR202_gn00822 [Eleusine coracana subsp. coracana]